VRIFSDRVKKITKKAEKRGSCEQIRKKTEKYTTIQGGNNHAVEVADITTNTAQNIHNTEKNDVVNNIFEIFKNVTFNTRNIQVRDLNQFRKF